MWQRSVPCVRSSLIGLQGLPPPARDTQQLERLVPEFKDIFTKMRHKYWQTDQINAVLMQAMLSQCHPLHRLLPAKQARVLCFNMSCLLLRKKNIYILRGLLILEHCYRKGHLATVKNRQNSGYACWDHVIPEHEFEEWPVASYTAVQ